MTEMFVSDITDGIAGTGVKAAFLKCAIDAEGLTRGVERVLRAVAQAHLATGAPVTVHTHPASRSGLVAIGVLAQEGADLSRVVIGHSGDTDDLDYLAEVADAGCLLGMDRFGDTDPPAFGQRVKTVAGMCERGYAASMVLSHDTACFIDWFPHDDATGRGLHPHPRPRAARTRRTRRYRRADRDHAGHQPAPLLHAAAVVIRHLPPLASAQIRPAWRPAAQRPRSGS